MSVHGLQHAHGQFADTIPVYAYLLAPPVVGLSACNVLGSQLFNVCL
jgi:hypothetical protein